MEAGTLPKNAYVKYLNSYLSENGSYVCGISFNSLIIAHVVSLPQEQHSTRNFAFLKMITLYMLWSAHFLKELHAVFCICQIFIWLKI